MTFSATPQDARLPGLTALLDADAVKALLEPQIREAGGRILDCRVSYVRYRPGRNCVASYVVTHQDRTGGTPRSLLWYGVCLTAERFAKAHRKVAARPWVKPLLGQPVTALAGYKMLLFAYPNDRRLDGLRVLGREDTLRRFLHGHLSKERFLSDKKITTTTLRYKPENRAVLRCETEARPGFRDESSETTVYLRVYSNERAAATMHGIMDRLLRWLTSRADLAIPQPLAFDSDQNILLLGPLPGITLRSAIKTARDAREAIERTARALATLHGYDDPKLPRRTVADHLARAQRATRLLAQFAPELAEQAEEIGHVLHARAPRDRDCVYGFVHGDFHYDQVLVDPAKVGFLDFDQAHTGPVAADLGNLLAHLRYRRIKGRRVADATLADAFLEAYVEAAQKPLAPGSISWWTALALLQIGIKPIRRLDADGPHKVRKLVEEVKGVFQRE